jgi:hypothetical protein
VIHIRQSHLRTLTVAAVATAAVSLGAAGAVSATTEPPTDTAAMGTEAPPADGSAPADAAAFCAAEVAFEAALPSEDPEVIGPALEALAAAAPDEISDAVESLAASAQAGPDDPAFVEAHGAIIEYAGANCGFAELGVTGSEYAFGGIPEEVPAGPTIVTFENIGEEVHEFVVFRINDDVTLSVEELLALPEEEAITMVTQVGGTFAFPGEAGQTVLDLTPGRHVALCFVPQGMTPEVIAEMEAAEASAPEGSAPAGSAPAGTDHAEMTADTAPADSATTGTAPADGSAPTGSAPPGEGPPHFTLGMIQEFTVV